MSLVNKMLRDLDARKAGENERSRLPSAVTPLAVRVEGKRNLPWAIIAIAALTGLAGALWYGMQKPATAPISRPSLLPGVAALSLPPPQPAAAVKEAPPKVAAAPSPHRPAAASVISPAGPQEPALRKETSLRTLPAPSSSTGSALFASSRNTSPVQQSPATAEARIEKQLRQPTPAERAETEYRRGMALQRQGQADDALNRYRAALADQAEHVAARQTMAALLIEMRRFDEAEDVLSKGIALAPTALPSTLALARLKVERGEAPAALDLLLAHVAAGERSAEYQGFLATLLNRAGRRSEAMERYQAATRLAPNEARWWAGLGIVLEAEGKTAAAREAYVQARALPGLPDDLTQHIEQRLRQ